MPAKTFIPCFGLKLMYFLDFKIFSGSVNGSVNSTRLVEPRLAVLHRQFFTSGLVFGLLWDLIEGSEFSKKRTGYALSLGSRG